MRRLLISILLTSYTYLCDAQNYEYKYKTIKVDTINIRGVVYDATGKPAPNVLLTSKNYGQTYYGYPLIARTDAQGKFELKGALVKDTINITSLNGYITVINNSSRYLEVTLLSMSTKLQPLVISATRKFKKKPTPTFKLITNAAIADYGCTITKLPSFPGGDESFKKVIIKHLVYPEKAIENNIEGDVEIGFVVDRDGSIKDLKVMRGIGYGCDEQVINAIIKSPHWAPGFNCGRPVTMPSSITINFKLTDK